ncbi:ABC transporter ATP-binding protein [Bacillus ndiopicus]|uniref:ABC transporter ATP-binding protein n=1 Tax=Bacillus ndiopicus TaxID=1347368 RepID=UPI000AD5B5B4|nr:ABC transporter ATP-binding protein [Bacillus ndiopicus]
MISVKQLTKHYQAFRGAAIVKAVDGISLTIEAGEFIGIMGPSGSGKTTLLNMLAGIEPVTAGEITIANTDITKLSKDRMAQFRRGHVGYIFQDFNLLDSISVKENIGLPLILDRRNPKIVEQKTQELMEYLNIAEIAGNAPAQISGGQKQRVAAARALITEPAVIFADEPTGNLDSKSANDLMLMLQRLNDERQNTIVMVTHDAFTASFCKKIIFIKDGKVEMTIVSNGDRLQFFDRILEAQSAIGGAVR